MSLIQVFVPSYRNTDSMCTQIIEHAIGKAAEAGHQIVKMTHASAMVDVARNKCLIHVSDQCDFVLWIDDDMKPEPDAISKIVALNRPFASALCTTRTEPVQLALKHWHRDREEFSNWEDYAPTRLIEGDYGVGAAFLCVRRDALREIVGYHLHAQDWLDWNRKMLDRLHVRAEYREKERARKEALRRKNYEQKGELRVFETEVHDGSEKRLGEDLIFCWRALQLGIPVSVDPTIRVGHTGHRDFYLEDYQPPKHFEKFASFSTKELGLEEVLA